MIDRREDRGRGVGEQRRRRPASDASDVDARSRSSDAGQRPMSMSTRLERHHRAAPAASPAAPSSTAPCAPIASTMRSYSWKASAATISATQQQRDRAEEPDQRERGGAEDDAAQDASHAARTDRVEVGAHFAPAATGRRDAAEAAIALLIREHAFEQVPAAEVGPQRVGDPDLRVGDLPQQEIADAHLAARPDQQIGIGLAGGVEQARETVARRDPSGLMPASIARRAASTISVRPP